MIPIRPQRLQQGYLPPSHSLSAAHGVRAGAEGGHDVGVCDNACPGWTRPVRLIGSTKKKNRCRQRTCAEHTTRGLPRNTNYVTQNFLVSQQARSIRSSGAGRWYQEHFPWHSMPLSYSFCQARRLMFGRLDPSCVLGLRLTNKLSNECHSVHLVDFLLVNISVSATSVPSFTLSECWCYAPGGG